MNTSTPLRTDSGSGTLAEAGVPAQRTAGPAPTDGPGGQSLLAEVRSSGLLFGLAAVVTVGVAAAVQAAATLVG